MMKEKRKISIAYTVLFVPIIYVILLSFPSYDDYDLYYYMEGTFSVTRAIEKTIWMYRNWQGDWFASIWQFGINPLLFFRYDSLGYGIEMIILTGMFFLCFIFCMNKITRFVLGLENIKASWLTFIITAIFAMAFSYKEVFCWFDGFCYALYMGTTLLTIAWLIDYFFTGKHASLYAGIVAGMISCVSLPNCVPVGMTLLYLWWMKPNARGKRQLKDLMVMILYILSAFTNVLAPGNYYRLDNYENELHIGSAIVNTIHFIAHRGAKCIINPTVFVGIIVLLYMTICAVDIVKIDVNVKQLLLYIIVCFISLSGAIFPVTLGYSNWYMPNRICFVFDSLFIPMLCFGVILVGSKIRGKVKLNNKLIPVLLLGSFVIATLFNSKSPWGVPLLHSDRILAERNAWIGIMRDLDESEGQDIIVTADKIEETGLYYGLGITENDEWPNGPIAYYFGKNSVRIKWND